MGIIYCVTNMLNEKKYVGNITSRRLIGAMMTC